MLRATGAAALGGAASLPVSTLAGMINVVVTNPLWVLVTRLQARSRQGPLPQQAAGEEPQRQRRRTPL